MLDNLQHDLDDFDMPTPLPPTIAAADSSGLALAMALQKLPLLALETSQQQIIELNAPAVELLGGSRETLKGRHLRDWLHRECDQGWLAELKANLFGLLPVKQTILPDLEISNPAGEPWRCEAMAVGWQSEQGLPLILLRLDAAMCESPDKLQSWAEHQAASYTTLLEGLIDGFLGMKGTGEITVANSSAQHLLGLTQPQLVGRNLNEIFPTLSTDEIRLLLRSNEDYPDEHMLVPVMLQGEPRQFEFTVHQQPDGMGILFRDVTEVMRQQLEIAKLNATMSASQELLRRKNDELNTSLAQLARLNDQLTQVDQLKGEFLSNTSHELRTPLNSIIGFLQLIDEGLCENVEEQTTYVRNALTSAKQLLTLINDLLDITKIEAGQMNFLIENHDVEDMFQEVYSITHVHAQQKQLKYTLALRGVDRLTIRADIHKTVQVLVNLVGNAFKFTDVGGVEVFAEPDPGNEDLVRFTVQDTGIGVPTSQQRQIFEKFIQADGSATRRHQGTGLGLAITKNLVEMMGGTIGIYSEGEGLGTTLTFTLPRALNLPERPAMTLSDEDLDELLPDTF